MEFHLPRLLLYLLVNAIRLFSSPLNSHALSLSHFTHFLSCQLAIFYLSRSFLLPPLITPYSCPPLFFFINFDLAIRIVLDFLSSTMHCKQNLLSSWVQQISVACHRHVFSIFPFRKHLEYFVFAVIAIQCYLLHTKLTLYTVQFHF